MTLRAVLIILDVYLKEIFVAGPTGKGPFCWRRNIVRGAGLDCSPRRRLYRAD